MRLLLATIGMHDPVQDGATRGAATVVEELYERPPDRVYLLPSRETVPQAERTRGWLLQARPSLEIVINPIEVADPASYGELMRVLPGQIYAICEVAHSEAGAQGEQLEVVCCPTSGTPQMQEVLTLTIASGMLPVPVQTYQVVEPRYADSGSRLRVLDLGLLRRQEEIKLALEHYRRGAFASCAEELERISQRENDRNSRRLRAIEILASFACALVHLDNAAYSSAWSCLQDLRKRVASDEELDAGLRGTLAGLARFVERSLQPRGAAAQAQRLIDLHYRAVRRVRQGAYADALNAIWILRELALSFRLKQVYGIESQFPEDQSTNPGNLDRLKQAPNFEDQRWQRHMDAFSVRRALSEVFGDEACRSLDAKSFPWGSAGGSKLVTGAVLDERLNNSRNDHEHRGKEIEPGVAQVALDYGRALLEAFVPDATMHLESYPFRPEAIEAVAERLSRNLLAG